MIHSGSGIKALVASGVCGRTGSGLMSEHDGGRLPFEFRLKTLEKISLALVTREGSDYLARK